MKEAQWASVEQVADQLEKHTRRVFPTALVPTKTEGVAGEIITVGGDFVVPPLSIGPHTLRLYLGNVRLDSITFTVQEKQEEVLPFTAIQAAYEQAFSERHEQAWVFFDSNYKPASLEQIQAVLDSTEIDDMRYEKEYFDCDDFAFALMGMLHMNYETAAQAIFYTTVRWEQSDGVFLHALCSCFTGQEVLIIEPQSDGIYSVPDNWRLTRLIG